MARGSDKVASRVGTRRPNGGQRYWDGERLAQRFQILTTAPSPPTRRNKRWSGRKKVVVPLQS